MIASVLVLLACGPDYATREDLARLEGRIEAMENGGGGRSAKTTEGGQEAGAEGAGKEGGAEGGGKEGGGKEGGPANGAAPGADGEASEELQAMEAAFGTALESINNGDVEAARTALLAVTADYPDTQAATEAKNLAGELELVGKSAPSLSLRSWVQGSAVPADGKALLVVFFLPGDRRVDENIGRAQETVDAWKDKGLAVVGVLGGDGIATDKITAWLASKKITFPVASDPGGTVSAAFLRKGTFSGVLIKDSTVVWSGDASHIPESMLSTHVGS